MIFLIVSVSASITLGDQNSSLQTTYGVNEKVKGWVNFSLENEDARKLFSSEDDSISLMDLLELNDLEYLCNPITCKPEYEAIGDSSVVKNKNLNNGESVVFGIVFEGEVIDVTSVNFNITSDAGESCNNQIYVDLFDGLLNYSNEKMSNSVCSTEKDYSCYDSSNSNVIPIILKGSIFCQKFIFDKSPGVRVGATLSGNGNSQPMTFSLLDKDKDNVGSCLVNENSGNIDCDIDFSIETKDYYYVCAEGVADTTYKIKGYQTELGCGYMEGDSEFDTSAYSIFAQEMKYESIGDMEFDEDDLRDSAIYYLDQNYNNDCENGCTIPIKVTSYISNQEIEIKDLNIEYRAASIGSKPSSNIYILEEGSVLTNMNFSSVYLDDANFSVGNELGYFDFNLKYDDKKFIDEKFSIASVSSIKDIYPKKSPAGFPARFIANVQLAGINNSITKYEWTFGDNEIETTYDNFVYHSYNSLGTFELSLTVTDSYAKTFSHKINVVAESPKDKLNDTLKTKLIDLKNVKAQIETFPTFVQTDLNSYFDFESSQKNLTAIQSLFFKGGNSDVSLISLMIDLVKLNIPNSVNFSFSVENIPFYTSKNNIDLDVLSNISRGDYGNKNSEYEDAILIWNQDFTSVIMDFVKYSAVYDRGSSNILNSFDINVDSRDNFYIFIEMSDINSDLGFKKTGDYFYADVEGSESFSFTTNPNVEFKDLPMFISPGISDLNIEDLPEKEEKISKWVIFILVIVFLILLSIGVYIFLQIWYKKKYESHLFLNKNNLYNMINYVKNSKDKGMDNKKIALNLKKSGWKSEQVAYVMKKYGGKRTGMVEIPIDKITGLFKKKSVEKKIVPKRGFNSRFQNRRLR